jgi:monoterpene epsilon-lactone hydrolase
MVESTKGTVTGVSAREPFDEVMERTPPADRVTYEKAEVDGVLGWWCRPINSPHDAAILYFHGGAYVVGSARERVSAFVPEYSLGPEHPFPAGVEDAQASFAGLVKHGFGRIVLAGDSAGGRTCAFAPVISRCRSTRRTPGASCRRGSHLSLDRFGA